MLNRWDPFAEIARLHDEMVRMQSGATTEAPYRGGFSPPVDIFDEDGAILVCAELPGLKPEDVHISVENDVLTLKGERKLENEAKRDGYIRVERSYGTFTRSFSLPKTVDGSAVEADMSDGVLTVKLPKRKAPEPKRIEVKAGAQRAPVTPSKPS